jgi:hypothetical protein
MCRIITKGLDFVIKWTITMDGLEIGLEGDWSLEFLNAEDYISGKVLTKDFFKALLENIQKYDHYHWRGLIKNVKSSNGDDLSDKLVGLLLGSAKEDEIKFGILYGQLTTGDFKVIAIWDDTFANTCKELLEEQDLCGSIIERIITTPEYFADVTTVLKQKDSKNDFVSIFY